MIDLNDAVSLLQAKRKELVDQLNAVDRALAALSSVAGAVTMAPEENPPQATEKERAPDTVLPIRLKPRRTLSEDHRHALNEGRREARHSKDAAAGLAREMTDDPSGLAGASAAHGRQPRLVKRK
jgi:hypothetical protein